MCDNCKCKNLLKRKNITATKLRRAVIKTLTMARTGLTPNDILKNIRAFQSINKVTLYRILELLEKKEILRKVLTNSNISRYELIDPMATGKQNLPPHFVCRICKTIIPIKANGLYPMIEKKVCGKFSGPIELTIEGICEKCKAKEAK